MKQNLEAKNWYVLDMIGQTDKQMRDQIIFAICTLHVFWVRKHIDTSAVLVGPLWLRHSFPHGIDGMVL